MEKYLFSYSLNGNIKDKLCHSMEKGNDVLSCENKSSVCCEWMVWPVSQGLSSQLPRISYFAYISFFNSRGLDSSTVPCWK